MQIDMFEDAKETDCNGREVMANNEADVKVDYQKYITSTKWRNIRKQILQHRGRVCEVCKKAHYRLEVHHLTYERLGAEKYTDLLVVCPDCHAVEDKKREVKVADTKRARRYKKSLYTWTEKVFGEHADVDEYQEEEFERWLERKEYRDG